MTGSFYWFKCLTIDVLLEYIRRSIFRILPVKYLKDGVSLENSYLPKAVNYFCQQLCLRCLTEFWICLWFNHKLYFEIYFFYLNSIPCIIFLCANVNKLSHSSLVQNWQIFQARFSCLAVISQVANYKSSWNICHIALGTVCDTLTREFK